MEGSAKVHRVTVTRRRRGAASLFLLVGGLLAVGLGVPGAASEPGRTAVASAAAGAGAAGIGDDYFPLDGNGGIDVLRYRIHDTYRFEDRHLSGRTRLRVRATEDLARFNLDFLLPVSKVVVAGRPAAHRTVRGHELVITPSQPVLAGEVVTVDVRYAGFPSRVGYLGERNWLADDHEVVAMNQPHMAPWWFPANDHPQDKALMDIAITVPRGHRVIANGHEVSRKRRGDRTTYRWRADEPMATYLAFFAAGRFQVARGETAGGTPWLVAVSQQLPRGLRRDSMRLMRKTPRVLSWLESQLGEYPFADVGGLTTSLNPGFALENQTRPTYPVLGAGATDFVVHELAHQWFGDDVAVHEWRDIWLNEGAATFMEWRYAETHGGQSAAARLEQLWEAFDPDDGFWEVRVADPGRGEIFSWSVYDRGAMALQALRQRVGEDDFWTILRTWLTERSGGTGTTDQFTALAEQVSGVDLDEFFHAWLVAPTRPDHTSANGW